MIFTKLAIAFGVLLFAGLCVLAAAGFTPIIAPLVTVFMLVVLIAGGNLLSGPRGGAGPPGGAGPREGAGPPGGAGGEDP